MISSENLIPLILMLIAFKGVCEILGGIFGFDLYVPRKAGRTEIICGVILLAFSVMAWCE